MPWRASLLDVISETSRTLDNLGCAICLVPIAEYPVSCKGNDLCCGIFCMTCFQKWGNSCPMCRENGGYRTEKGLRRLINNISVGCKKCGAEITVQDWNEHEDTVCPEVELSCILGCEKSIKRSEMEKHTTTECPLRKQECKRCGEQTLVSKIHKTQKECILQLKRRVTELSMKSTEKEVVKHSSNDALLIVCKMKKSKTFYYRYDTSSGYIHSVGALSVRDNLKFCCLHGVNMSFSIRSFRSRQSNQLKYGLNLDMVSRLNAQMVIARWDDAPSLDASTEFIVASNHKNIVLCAVNNEPNCNHGNYYTAVCDYSEIGRGEPPLFTRIRCNDMSHWEAHSAFAMDEYKFCVIRAWSDPNTEPLSNFNIFDVVDTQTNTVTPLPANYFQVNNLNVSHLLNVETEFETILTGFRPPRIYIMSAYENEKYIQVAVYFTQDGIIVKRSDSKIQFTFTQRIKNPLLNIQLYKPYNVCYLKSTVYVNVDVNRNNIDEDNTPTASTPQPIRNNVMYALQCTIPSSTDHASSATETKEIKRLMTEVQFDIPHIHHITPSTF